MRLLAILLIVAGTSVTAQQLPAGPGADVLKSRCLSCHEADIVTSQKLSLTGWTNSVAKMIRWGSQITPQEREVLQPYLAAHFAPRPVVSHPTAAAGEATYKRACLTCHDADIVEQQKLSKAGWTNSVNKMVRWGAAVPEAEREPLAEYLFSRFPPR
ncbi:MAG TPA: c-type cytochrome [Vicinamibacterales bacterium]|nr:c-type cytochrome [Vicinamibacterales bacterium]